MPACSISNKHQGKPKNVNMGRLHAYILHIHALDSHSEYPILSIQVLWCYISYLMRERESRVQARFIVHIDVNPEPDDPKIKIRSLSCVSNDFMFKKEISRCYFLPSHYLTTAEFCPILIIIILCYFLTEECRQKVRNGYVKQLFRCYCPPKCRSVLYYITLSIQSQSNAHTFNTYTLLQKKCTWISPSSSTDPDLGSCRHRVSASFSQHSQCVTNIEVSRSFSGWSNVGQLTFDQHLVK